MGTFLEVHWEFLLFSLRVFESCAVAGLEWGYLRTFSRDWEGIAGLLQGWVGTGTWENFSLHPHPKGSLKTWDFMEQQGQDGL